MSRAWLLACLLGACSFVSASIADDPKPGPKGMIRDCGSLAAPVADTVVTALAATLTAYAIVSYRRFHDEWSGGVGGVAGTVGVVYGISAWAGFDRTLTCRRDNPP
jgi:hypothetical protein